MSEKKEKAMTDYTEAETMPGNLSQQEYAQEARRLYRLGVPPDEIRRITGFFVLGNDGRPLRFVL